MNNFSGNANYVEFVNFGDWAGFKLATNSAVNMAARFAKAVSVSVLDSASAPITGAIVYRLDTNNGSRTHYAADEHFIQTTAAGAASGKILALVGRLPAGAATNSTQYTAFMDCRNAANDQSGNDVLRYVSYEHLLNNRAINTKGINTLTVEQTLFDDPSITLDKAGAIAKLASSFTVDTVGKVVTVTANSTFDDIYDALKAHKATANAVNLATPTLDALIVTPNGTQLNGFTGWTLSVNNGVVLNQGTKFDSVAFTTVNLNTSGQITGLYSAGGASNKILEINGVTNGSSLYVGNNATGITTLYQDDTDQATYRVYFAPGTTPAQLVARELYAFQRSAQVITLVDGLNVVNLIDIPDIGITEETLATVLAYTQIETPSKFYDRTAAFRLTEQGIKLGQMVTRSGTALEIGNFSHLINKDATLVYSVTGLVITTKSLSYAGDSRYTTEIANPPATITANTTEVITIVIEDANGNSQVTINGGDGNFELWKVTTATATADYATGTLLATVGNGVYRFIGVTGFDIVGVDINSNIRRRSSMAKGIYTQAFYVGDQIQLAQAPEVTEINTKVDILQIALDAVQAKTDNLPDEPAAVGDAMTLTSEYDAAKTAASQASVDALGTPLQAGDVVDANIVKVNDIFIDGVGTKTDPFGPV
jgi:hypothetical protein